MPFAVPGKVPLYLEGAAPAIGAETEDVIGLELRAGAGEARSSSRAAPHLTPALAARLRGAALVLFDGTLWPDDEMIRSGTGVKTGARMGHMSISGPDGTLAAFAPLGVRRKILIHINNTNPILLDDSAERTRGRGGWLGGGLRRHGDRRCDPDAERRGAGSGAARIGDERYHWNHPFHKAMKGGGADQAVRCRPGRSIATTISRTSRSRTLR